MLRRTKATQIDGRPIVVLPPKTTRVVELDFSPQELIFYKALEKRQQDKFQDMMEESNNRLGSNYANILVGVWVACRGMQMQPGIVALHCMSLQMS